MNVKFSDLIKEEKKEKKDSTFYFQFLFVKLNLWETMNKNRGVEFQKFTSYIDVSTGVCRYWVYNRNPTRHNKWINK